MNKYWKYTYTLLLLTLAAIVIAIFQLPDKNLHIIACDVGQGDAILVTYKNTQVLTDGGPDNKVLDCLGKHLPFYDREIELVILTHPDADHATGLVSVLQAYKVGKILINPVDPGTSVYQALVFEVGGRDIEVINPTSGMRLGLSLIHLDVLSPNEQLFSGIEINPNGDSLNMYPISKETNLYSIVYLLSFGKFKGLFPGDIPPKVSDSLAGVWELGSVNYIKIPHHGSVNGITEDLLKAVMPKIAVISVGKNQWGLPKKEILNMLSKYGIKTLRTDEWGDIEFVTDGEKYWIRK